MLELECNLHETFERMKHDLEEMEGFSTKLLFKILDKNSQGFIDSNSLTVFLYMYATENKLKKS